LKIPTKEDEVWRISLLIEKEFFDVRIMFEKESADFVQDQVLKTVKKLNSMNKEKTLK